MFTVRHLLNLPAFKELRIIAGEKALDNVITSVNIMDNPDALDWFSPGEILVTSGYFFKDSKEEQDKVLRQLRNINCPALCIKPRKYFGSTPQNIILLGDKLGLPVIELPYGLSFAKITSLIMQEISEKYDVINRKSLEIHEEFLKISLHGGGLSKICSSLSTMIENPVVLLDKYWNVLHWNDFPDDPLSISHFMELSVSQPFVDSDFIRTLPLEFESLQKPLARDIEIKNRSVSWVIMPVSINSVHHGYILVWNTIRDMVEIDYIALENAAMSFALERIRNNELERTKNRIRRDFFDELLSGKIQTTENLHYLCEIHGVNPSLWYTPIMLNLEFEETGLSGDLIERKRAEDEKVRETLRFMDEYSGSGNFIIHAFSQNSQIIVLLGTKPNDSALGIPGLKVLISEMIKEMEVIIPGIHLKGGIGRTSRNLLDLHRSFYQAQEALRLVKKSSPDKKICHFEDFIVHHFLEENISNIEMRKFFENALGPIYEYDRKYKSDLLPTFESWISHHFNVAETARSLFAHRNTILYRIDRISTILQSDLKDSDELLKYQLALKIYRLLDI